MLEHISTFMAVHSIAHNISIKVFIVAFVEFALTLDPTAGALLPAPFNSTTCDVESLLHRVTELNAVCCVGSHELCDGWQCSVPCASVLVPLHDDCSAILDVLYDFQDGVRDGHASWISDIFSKCTAIPVYVLVGHLKDATGAGRCSPDVLDDVGLTAVVTKCEDTWNHDCRYEVQSGGMTCEEDFCNTPPTSEAPCSLAGHCDQTCGFCRRADDGNKHL
eukprot:SAG11_NODE_6752_length_1254_cov_1.027706_1_plen_219_part_10